jgi:hypothetical protein
VATFAVTVQNRVDTSKELILVRENGSMLAPCCVYSHGCATPVMLSSVEHTVASSSMTRRRNGNALFVAALFDLYTSR